MLAILLKKESPAKHELIVNFTNLWEYLFYRTPLEVSKKLKNLS